MPHHHRHRQHVELEKRQRLTDGIISIIGNLRPKDDTVVSTIYVTAKPTFDGPIGGYSTEGRPGSTANVAPPIQNTSPSDDDEPTTTRRPPPRPTSTSTPTPTLASTSSSPTPPSSRPKLSSTAPSPTSFVTSAPSTSQLIASSTASNDAAGSSGSPTPSATDVPAPGMSTGAKAGLAIGILALIGLLAGVALLFIRKKKKKNEAAEALDNEKPAPPPPMINTYAPPAPQSQMAPTVPPQLNIRPVTEFSPDLTGHSANGQNMAAGAGAGAVGARSLTGQHNISPPRTADSTSNPFNDPVNPFEPRSGASSPMSSPVQPVLGSGGGRTPSPESLNTGAAAAGAAAAAVGVAAVATGAAAKGHSGKPPTLQHVAGPPPGWSKDAAPPSPARSLDSVSVTSATAAAVATSGPGPNNVHRVQLDFSPSMDDELELRAGQLVRLLHEYDDGWALCIRLDRSQQGVAPRTCLSARPVKPRPRNGPGPRGPPMIRDPNGRPSSPAGGRNSPAPGPQPTGPLPNAPPRFSPQQNGPPSPTSGYRPYNPNASAPPAQFPEVPRTASPGPSPRIPQPRSMSPGPYGAGVERPQMPEAQRKRSNSSAGAAGRLPPSNPGPSALGAVQTVEPNSEPANKPIEPPTEQPAEPVSKPPAETPVEKPSEKPAEKPADKPADDPVRSPSPTPGTADRKPVTGNSS
ncbi:hypothetical protein LOZ53_005856 [Ophidiomyces ophidiicola]|nr:hypothetical protein LOZ55_000320 [Ophidiomyces ophidiicola]KAI1983476.1 hypothetical protein LOZ53_005856 [Ophidiomyces ophidiicola]KAI1986025.1 hypothetical protein LOZ54_004034 [Ophidiomyces ophidiicola]KAI2003646.1 hypothetical protein LOZ51_000728 [Ophidiomyces ophidiicola]